MNAQKSYLYPSFDPKCWDITLAPDGCKFRPGEAHVSSGEPRGIFELKLNMTKNVQSSEKYRDIYIDRAKFYIDRPNS
jgi:hypothetical protein